MRSNPARGSKIRSSGTLVCIGHHKSYAICLTASHILKVNRLDGKYMLGHGNGACSENGAGCSALKDNYFRSQKITPDLSLIAIPLSDFKINRPKPLKIAEISNVQNSGSLYTVGRNGSVGLVKKRYYTTYEKSGEGGSVKRREGDELMMAWSTSRQGDSGSAVLTEDGKLAGIVVMGDRKFTVAIDILAVKDIKAEIESFKRKL